MSMPARAAATQDAQVFHDLVQFNQSHVRNLPVGERRKVTINALAALSLVCVVGFVCVNVAASASSSTGAPVDVDDSLAHASPAFVSFVQRHCGALVANLASKSCQVDSSEFAWRSTKSVAGVLTFLEICTIVLASMAGLMVVYSGLALSLHSRSNNEGDHRVCWPQADTGHMGIMAPTSLTVVMVGLLWSTYWVTHVHVPAAASCPPAVVVRGRHTGDGYRACPIALDTQRDIDAWSNQTVTGAGTGGFVVLVLGNKDKDAVVVADLFVALTFSNNVNRTYGLGENPASKFRSTRALLLGMSSTFICLMMLVARKAILDIVEASCRAELVRRVRATMDSVEDRVQVLLNDLRSPDALASARSTRAAAAIRGVAGADADGALAAPPADMFLRPPVSRWSHELPGQTGEQTDVAQAILPTSSLQPTRTPSS